MDFNNNSFLGTLRILLLKGEKGDKGDNGESGDYSTLINKPKINNVTVDGDITGSDLGLASQVALETVDNFVGLISEFIEDNAPSFANNMRVYLTGGGLSYLRGIKSHLSARLGMPVEILVPKVPMHSKPDEASTFAMLNFALKDKESR